MQISNEFTGFMLPFLAVAIAGVVISIIAYVVLRLFVRLNHLDIKIQESKEDELARYAAYFGIISALLIVIIF